MLRCLTELADNLGVRDSVLFPGFPGQPLPNIAAADLLCMPPRYEGFPLVLLEALALGVPVIASPSDRDLLDEGAYGIIVPGESPKNLASAIGRHPRLLSLRTPRGTPPGARAPLQLDRRRDPTSGLARRAGRPCPGSFPGLARAVSCCRRWCSIA